MSSCSLRKTKSLETSCESCRHVVFRQLNRLGHLAKVVVMSSSENEIAWDILRKMSSCRRPKTKSLETSCKSCRHVFFRKRKRLGHPAKVVVVSSPKHEIAWDILQMLLEVVHKTCTTTTKRSKTIGGPTENHSEKPQNHAKTTPGPPKTTNSPTGIYNTKLKGRGGVRLLIAGR